MKCWGTVRPRQAACDRTATTWLVLRNVQYAMCERHAAANEDKRLRPMGSGRAARRPAREAPR